MDAAKTRVVDRIATILEPAQAESHARRAVLVKAWRRLTGMDSESIVAELQRRTKVPYKTCQRWARWSTLPLSTLRRVQGGPQDRQRALDALVREARASQLPLPAVVLKPGTHRWVSPDGTVELLQGDCLKLLPDYPAESFSGAVTDQPYGVAYHNTGGLTVENDLDPEPIASALAPLLGRVLVPHSFAILHGVFKRLDDGRYVDQVWRDHLAQAGVPLVDIAVWDKGRPGPGGYLMHSHEQVWVCTKGSPTTWTQDSDVWRFARPADSPHPTPKPPELHIQQMKVFTPPGGLVLDPCMGTGVTAIAALRTGRRYVGMEIDEEWFAKAVERVEEELAR